MTYDVWSMIWEEINREEDRIYDDTYVYIYIIIYDFTWYYDAETHQPGMHLFHRDLTGDFGLWVQGITLRLGRRGNQTTKFVSCITRNKMIHESLNLQKSLNLQNLQNLWTSKINAISFFAISHMIMGQKCGTLLFSWDPWIFIGLNIPKCS